MKYSAPYTNIAERDLIGLRDYTQALEENGFDAVSSGGHLLSSAPGSQPQEPNLRRYIGPFYDPFVIFSYMAAVTTRLHFRAAVLALPLVEVGLVAKQTSELQFVSDGRFELGVGLSWNETEFKAMNKGFRDRARRIEEQVTLLRQLLTDPYVSFEGRYHHYDQIGLNYAPPQVPIWFGSQVATEPVLRRMARLGDGWLPLGADLREAMPRLRRYLEEEGRDPDSFQIGGRIWPELDSKPADWISEAKELQALGATEIAIFLRGSKWTDLERLIEIRRALAETIG